MLSRPKRIIFSGVICAGFIGLATGSVVGQDQARVDETPSTKQGPATMRLLDEIEQMKKDILMLSELHEFETNMLAGARTDPAAMLNLRKPYAQCVESVLAPVCDRLEMLFAPPVQHQSTPQTRAMRVIQ